MNLSRRKLLAGAAGVATVAAAGIRSQAFADTFPSKAIQVVCGFLPGAAADLTARIVGDSITPILGQRMVVETKPGANSLIALDYVARSAPDGYTLCQTTFGGLAVLPAVKPDCPFTPESFTYISRLAKQSQVLAINPALPIKSMAEFIAYGKAHPPGTLRCGTAGAGGIPDMTTVLLSQLIGVEITRVPYSGTAANVTAVMGGEVDMAFITPSSAGPYVKDGKIRVIAITGPEREPPLWADVPTMAELGFGSLTVENHFGLIGPAKIPPQILKQLQDGVVAALKDPKVIKLFQNADLTPQPLVGDDFKKLAVSEFQRWSAVAKSAHIVVE